MKGLFCAIFIVILASVWSCQQPLYKKDLYQKISVTAGDSVMEFRITEKKIKADPDKTYTWYYQDQIRESTGAYQGHLLEGSYRVLDRNGDMILVGEYNKGLKDGLWLKMNGSEILEKTAYNSGAVKTGFAGLAFLKGEKVGKKKVMIEDSVAVKMDTLIVNEVQDSLEIDAPELMGEEVSDEL